MPARMYYDNDADPSALAGQTVAIIGYGSQGMPTRRTSTTAGVDVVVGLRPAARAGRIAEGAACGSRTWPTP